MAGSSGWDPGKPPTAIDGSPTVPSWMGGVGLGQLQILSLQAADEDKKLSTFIVGKSIHDLVGDIEDARTEANGTKYVLRVRDAVQAKKLLNMKELFDDTAVKVELHPILNKRRCVISCREIQEETDEEVLKWMANERVVGIKRITRMVEGKKVNTPTIILTLNGTSVPDYIKVGALRVKTRIYIPDPMICYKCYAYGHTKFRCKEAARCRNCSNIHDTQEECQAAPFCLHCKGNHGPASRTCPTYALEKEIVRLRFTKGINYQEALKQIKAGGGSYAEISQVQQRLITARGNSQVSQQLKEKDDLIKQLMDTIAKLTTRIEELEKKSKSKKEKKRAKRIQASKDEDSWSEMETDSSNKRTTGQTAEASSQVSATPISSVQKHKRHPTTEIHFPLPKKPLANSNIVTDQNRTDPPDYPMPMKTPTNPLMIIDQPQSSKDSSRLDSLRTQSNNGQQFKPHK